MEIHPRASFESTWQEVQTVPDDDQILPEAEQGAGGQGPCLFLGSNGERCSRQATEDGFCARHQPGRVGVQALARAANVPSRALAAVVTIGVLLWPYIADAVKEILRWLAAR